MRQKNVHFIRNKKIKLYGIWPIQFLIREDFKPRPLCDEIIQTLSDIPPSSGQTPGQHTIGFCCGHLSFTVVSQCVTHFTCQDCLLTFSWRTNDDEWSGTRENYYNCYYTRGFANLFGHKSQSNFKLNPTVQDVTRVLLNIAFFKTVYFLINLLSSAS